MISLGPRTSTAFGTSYRQYITTRDTPKREAHFRGILSDIGVTIPELTVEMYSRIMKRWDDLDSLDMNCPVYSDEHGPFWEFGTIWNNPEVQFELEDMGYLKRNED